MTNVCRSDIAYKSIITFFFFIYIVLIAKVLSYFEFCPGTPPSEFLDSILPLESVFFMIYQVQSMVASTHSMFSSDFRFQLSPLCYCDKSIEMGIYHFPFSSAILLSMTE